jgi:tRNA threonylcarbamoyladenosine modification (KEOPS) complex Cgi121 subunit
MYQIYGARTEKDGLDTKELIEYIKSKEQENGLTLQLFDARMVFGALHLQTAFDHAKRSIDRGTAISSSLSMEILLYTAGEYQIKNALDKVGLKDDSKVIVLLCIADKKDYTIDPDELFSELCSKFGLVRDFDVIDGDKKYLVDFGISKDELSAIPEELWLDLVLEKVALVDIKK